MPRQSQSTTAEAPHGASEEALARLLEGLNPPQREAVTHGDGPLLILAGAGSGKTRALTHRIAYLIATGRARPGEILAITFTNKAANEMKERVERLVGAVSRLMWVMTFHSACARILRREAERLGYARSFTIYDEADSLRMVKRCLAELEIDPKRFNPRAVKGQISSAKNQLLDSAGYREQMSGFFEQTVADVYGLYEKRMHEANAMDFDDLLANTVSLLELFEDVRDRYRRTFRHVLVDEYQDTNRAQYRLLQLLTGAERNLCVVGDDDQCLVEGTLVTLADGSLAPIESVLVGDEVRSCYGSGDFRPARVTAVHKSEVQEAGVEIVTSGGRRIVSTADHVHFAGYRMDITPQKHFTYAMHKRGYGFRIGTTRVHTDRRYKPVIGLAQRSMQERADASWVVSVHDTEGEARAAEHELSLRYALPTIPFEARNGMAATGLVANQKLIDQVFGRVHSEVTGFQLLRDHGLSSQHPHHIPRSNEGRRRNITITLCSDRRGRVPMHTISIGGRDPEVKEALEGIGLNVRPAKNGSLSWRYESAFQDFGAVMEIAERIREVVDASLRYIARLGRPSVETRERNSLPFLPASSIRPGMAMFTEEGDYDVVETVRWADLDRPVYDLNVECTHNFVANGLITHNSIYAFRGAEIRNILDFEEDFPDAKVVKLEQNYRSTQTILSAGNSVVTNNRGRMSKSLWTEIGQGDPVQVVELADEHEEARYVAGEVERLADEEGMSRDEIAVFYRTNAQSRVLEDTMVRFNLPYQVIGGTKFYERSEIKDAVAYLSLLVNPADAVSFARVVNSPRRGIGQTSQARILAYANTTGLQIWDVASDPDAVPGLGASAVKSVGRFMSTMEGLRDRVEAAPVGELLEALLQEVGYVEALEAERTIEAEGRVENLQELVGVAREFDTNREVEGESELSPLAEFLQQIALYSEQDALRDERGLITLMTLHNAKGLEYDCVFMIGCEEGVFPHSRSVEEGNLEEERRLCYVGITRARQLLYLSFARQRTLFGARDWNLPSRFIDEVPEQLTQRTESEKPSTSWTLTAGSSLGSPAERKREAGTVSYVLGDDVLHASFGEGVVTGVEPGGVVTVRFADGSERKLMAEYAPMKKA